eukprot:1161403-Pelagomonas_calceolata.AAC.3
MRIAGQRQRVEGCRGAGRAANAAALHCTQRRTLVGRGGEATCADATVVSSRDCVASPWTYDDEA